MAIIYSDKEVGEQKRILVAQCEALDLSDWEENFVDSVKNLTSLSPKQKAIVSRIYLEKVERGN